MSPTLHRAAALAGGHCWVERRLFEVLGAWVPPAADPKVKLVLDRHAQHAAWRAAQWWDRLPVLASLDREPLVTAPPGWSSLTAAGPSGDRGVRSSATEAVAPAGPAAPGEATADAVAPAGPAAPGEATADAVRPARPAAPGEATADTVAPARPAAPGEAIADAAAGADLARLAVAYRVWLPRLAAAYHRHLAEATPVSDGPVLRTLGHVLPDLTADWAEGESLVQAGIDATGAARAAAAAVAEAEERFAAVSGASPAEIR